MGDSGQREISLTYWMNRLQPFIGHGKERDLFVTLNPLNQPKSHLVVASYEYEHPVYTGDVRHALSCSLWLSC